MGQVGIKFQRGDKVPVALCRQQTDSENTVMGAEQRLGWAHGLAIGGGVESCRACRPCGVSAWMCYWVSLLVFDE